MALDLPKFLENINNFKLLQENEILALLDRFTSILIEEPNILMLEGPISICGDLHGQFLDVQKLFTIGGDVPDTKYLFLGDFVDRGYFSVETCTKWPDRIFLLRGNHETRNVSRCYGFYDECLVKYWNPRIWNFFCQSFDLLPLAAIINNEIFCVHGGLSPVLKTIGKIQVIKRNCEPPNSTGFTDLLWSDPDEIENWQVSNRGQGYLFGSDPVDKFLYLNNFNLICRSHQLVVEGIKFMFDNKLVTVWSAPNYCYRCGNSATILNILENKEHEIIKFEADSISQNNHILQNFTAYYS